MKKILFFLFLLVSVVFGFDNPKTEVNCSVEKYEQLKKIVAEDPNSGAIIMIWAMEEKCPNLKK